MDIICKSFRGSGERQGEEPTLFPPKQPSKIVAVEGNLG